MILARVYVGDMAGGPVDYSAPAIETAADSWALPPLAPGQSRKVAVRFADPATGLEEMNTDAVILVSVDDSGNDVSAVPPSPSGLSVRDSAPDSAILTWQYNYIEGDEIPDAWDVYAGSPIDYAARAGTIPHNPNRARFSYELTGYAPGVPISVAVRSRKGSAHDPNTVQLTWTPPGIPSAATRPSVSATDTEI